jgi:N-glycosylase/DNA lyase
MDKGNTLEDLKSEYARRKDMIEAQLGEFRKIRDSADDRKIFEELAYCILTSAVGPKVGLRSLEAIKDILLEGTAEDTESTLKGIHKYPEKAYFIVHTREYLKREYGFKLRELVDSFPGPQERRDFFALNKDIKGLGYTQASHFLRNIGFGGYAILDKNVIKSLYDLGIIDSPKPPSTGKKYKEIENRMKSLAGELGIGLDELDMLLWSLKTGRIPV